MCLGEHLTFVYSSLSGVDSDVSIEVDGCGVSFWDVLAAGMLFVRRLPRDPLRPVGPFPDRQSAFLLCPEKEWYHG